MPSFATEVSLLPWNDTGLELLRAMNTPGQKLHLGGPETEEKLAERHARYLTYVRPGDVEMMLICFDGRIVGSTGYWEREWEGRTVYEAGWEVRPDLHGQGIGKAAVAQLIERLGPHARHGTLHAFPAPDNLASNAICRRLGFRLLGTRDFEYPKGHHMECNEWCLALPTSWAGSA